MLRVRPALAIIFLAAALSACSSDSAPERSLQSRTTIVVNDSTGIPDEPLFLIRDGKGERFGEARDFTGVALSPDGARLAVINDVGGPGDANFGHASELRIMEMDTGAESVIPAARLQGLQWAFDGSGVAALGEELIIASPEGKVVARRRQEGRDLYASFVGWSPDSTRFAVRRGEILEIVDARTNTASSSELSDLLAVAEPPASRLDVVYWLNDAEVLLLERPEEHTGTPDPHHYVIPASLDPAAVRRIGDAEIPTPDWWPTGNTLASVRATATALARNIKADDAESFGISSDWRAQLYRSRSRTTLYVQEFSTGDVFHVDYSEIGDVAGDEFMSVHIAPP